MQWVAWMEAFAASIDPLQREPADAAIPEPKSRGPEALLGRMESTRTGWQMVLRRGRSSGLVQRNIFARSEAF